MATGLEILPFLAAGLTVGSTALGIAGQIQAGQAAKAEAEYRAGISLLNAERAEENARRAQEDAEVALKNAEEAAFAGAQAAQDQDRLARLEIEALFAVQSASGLQGKSQLGKRKSLQTLASIDRQRLVQAGENEARKFRQQSEDFLDESADFSTSAEMFKADAAAGILSGRAEARGRVLAAVGTGFKGAAQLASQTPTLLGGAK